MTTTDSYHTRMVALPAQEPLGEPFQTILHESLWQLYERSGNGMQGADLTGLQLDNPCALPVTEQEEEEAWGNISDKTGALE